MKTSSFLIILFLLLFPALTKAKVTVSVSSAQNTALTVYNTGTALVYEDFHVFLPQKENHLEITGLPAGIESDSINIIEFKTFKILSYSFLPPNLTRREILKQYLNKKIKLVIWDKEKNTPTFYNAILLGGKHGEFYYKVDNKIFLDPPGSIVIPKIPPQLHTDGVLRAEYKIDVDTDAVVSLIYLTKGINWRGSYILNLMNEDRARLKCFARFENNTGREFRNAEVSLIAGSLHRAYQPKSEGAFRVKAMAEADRTATVKQAFEYYEYRVPKKITLHDGESKEVLLFSTGDLNYKKEYIAKTSANLYPTIIPVQKKIPVKVYINFKNNLGLPLPEGLVRIYSLYKRRHPVLLGSDMIEHTPVGRRVRLLAGEAFDLKVKKRQTDFTRLSRRVYESAYEITLSNHKKEDVRIKVIESLSGQWEILSTSHKYKKLDSGHIQFNPLVPAGTTLKITYRIRFNQ